MPYIKRERRDLFDEDVNNLLVKLIDENATAGDINYCISSIIWKLWELRGGNYSAANELMGALSGVDKEFYRRCVAPYEDKKIEENGDVYI